MEPGKQFILLLHPFSEKWRPQILVPELTRAETLYLGMTWDLEEALALGLGQDFPIIAFGPDRGQRLGAIRVDADDTDWHTKMEQMLARAALIFFVPGEGDGLGWELERIGSDNNILRKTILVRGLDFGSLLTARFQLAVLLSEFGLCKEPDYEIVMPPMKIFANSTETVNFFKKPGMTTDLFNTANFLLMAVRAPGFSFFASASKEESNNPQIWTLPLSSGGPKSLRSFILTLLNCVSTDSDYVSVSKLLELDPPLALRRLVDMDQSFWDDILEEACLEARFENLDQAVDELHRSVYDHFSNIRAPCVEYASLLITFIFCFTILVLVLQRLT